MGTTKYKKKSIIYMCCDEVLVVIPLNTLHWGVIAFKHYTSFSLLQPILTWHQHHYTSAPSERTALATHCENPECSSLVGIAPTTVGRHCLPWRRGAHSVATPWLRSDDVIISFPLYLYNNVIYGWTNNTVIDCITGICMAT